MPVSIKQPDATDCGTDTRTWANGFGNWYASVPAGENAAAVAKAVILRELRDRESNVAASRVGVRLVSSDGRTAVYAEVDPDEANDS